MRGQRATPGTQIAQLYAVPNLPAPHCTTVHNGGYRASSATQSKLRRVTREMVAPRRRSPNLARLDCLPIERFLHSERPVMSGGIDTGLGGPRHVQIWALAVSAFLDLPRPGLARGRSGRTGPESDLPSKEAFSFVLRLVRAA